MEFFRRENSKQSGKMEEVTVGSVENLKPTSCCRICHEEEFESSKRLESPCACSGTAKFAHRDCIQRWCDEKGSTTCEICLQKYEPGYTAPPKKAQVMEEAVTISVPRREYEAYETEDASLDTEFSKYLFQSAACCKTVALILTAILLLRHLLVLYSVAGHCPFSFFTVLALRSCGIVIPMCLIVRTITRFQNRLGRHHHLIRFNRDDGPPPEHSLHITIDIQSI